VAEDKEFADQAKDPPFQIIADYVFPGIENEALATALSGLIGVGTMAALGFGIAYGLRLMSRRSASNEGSSSTASGGG
jgi:cobalt/nickel transport protein